MEASLVNPARNARLPDAGEIDIDGLAGLAVEFWPTQRLRTLAKSILSESPDEYTSATEPDALMRDISVRATQQGKMTTWLQGLLGDSAKFDKCRAFFMKYLSGDSAMEVLTLGGFVQDWEKFMLSMGRAGGHVCKVCVDSNEPDAGTGFLIGPDLVLTAYHVVESLIDEKSGLARARTSQRIQCLFDYRMDSRGRILNEAPTPVDEDWLEIASPPYPDERYRFDPDRNVANTFDCAVIRLRDEIGNFVLPYDKSRTRSWIELPSEYGHADLTGQQILIAQHPGGHRLMLALGPFERYCCHDKRMHYKAATVNASSGAPCFDKDWNILGMHHAGYKAFTMNQGVPIDCIAQAINYQDLIDQNSQNGFDPFGVALRDGTMLFPRPDLVRLVTGMLSAADRRRILIIEGEENSGRAMCSRFIEDAAVSRRHEALRWDAEAMVDLSPEEFASRLVAGIKSVSTQSATDEQPARGKDRRKVPERPEDRQPARWIARTLAEWVAEQISSSVESKSNGSGQVRAPNEELSVWLIINRLDRFMLQPETHDLLCRLLQPPASPTDQALGRLKLVLVGYRGEMPGVDGASIAHYRTDSEPLTRAAIENVLHSVYRLARQPDDPEKISASAQAFWQVVAFLPPAQRTAVLGNVLNTFAGEIGGTHA